MCALCSRKGGIMLRSSEGKQFASVFSLKARELRKSELRTVGGGVKGHTGTDNQGRCQEEGDRPGFPFCG